MIQPFVSQFPLLQPTPTIQSRNSSIEDAPSNPKWVFLFPPKWASFALYALEECMTIGNYSAKFNN